MVFNSSEYLLFFVLVFVLYWAVFSKNKTSQNSFLLISSVFFYSQIDWRLPLLLGASIVFNYGLALVIDKSSSERLGRFFFWIGIFLNVGLLAYFKYLNFFYEEFVHLFNTFGSDLSYSPLSIIPFVGISFFTFQALGYLIDVYNGNTEPSRNLLSFSTYMYYFPKLLSGPIERAQHLIPQLETIRKFDYQLAVIGCKQILWGVFAKIVLADKLAQFINPIIANPELENGSTLLLCAMLYIIQIYCDFSGYSNMAIGFSKLLGINLSINFKLPLFAINISDFWKRWHISLTTWMMDYVFSPLSFLLRKHKKKGIAISISVTFIIVGIWHGANWTYLIFGVIQSLLFLPLAFRGSLSASASDQKTNVRTLVQGGINFIIVALSFSLLMMDDLQHAQAVYDQILDSSLFTIPDKRPTHLILIIILFLAFEWFSRNELTPLLILKNKLSRPFRWAIYYGLILLVFFYGGVAQQYIYFQY